MPLDILDSVLYDDMSRELTLEHSISVTPEEWDAIAACAVPENMIRNILYNGCLDEFKHYAGLADETESSSVGYLEDEPADDVGPRGLRLIDPLIDEPLVHKDTDQNSPVGYLEGAEYMIDSPENPYNPWTDFDSWYNYDIVNLGYHTYEHLARITLSTDNFPEYIQERLTMRAVDELIDAYPFRYTRAYKPS